MIIDEICDCRLRSIMMTRKTSRGKTKLIGREKRFSGTKSECFTTVEANERNLLGIAAGEDGKRGKTTFSA